MAYRAAIGVPLYDTLARGSIPIPSDVPHRAIPRTRYWSERLRATVARGATAIMTS